MTPGVRLRALAMVCGLMAAPAWAGEMRFEHVMTFGSEGTGEGQFKYVEDFAQTRDGRLLVTDAAHAYVQVFDKASGAFLDRFGGKGDGEGNLDKPEGIAVDPDGNIYVADYNSGFIKKYDPGFAWLRTFSDYGSEPGQTIMTEFMDIRDGKLYVPEAGNHRISVFTLDGDFLFAFGEPGNGPGQLNVPEAAKFGPDGLLYVSDLRNDRIQVFDAEGRLIRMWGETGSGPGQLKAPSGIGIDRAGNLYVAEIGNDRVQVFDPRGRHLAMWGRRGSGTGEFGNLHGVWVDGESGWIYVGDTANNRVQVFRPVP